jgi:regulator of RNase E activity RraA
VKTLGSGPPGAVTSQMQNYWKDENELFALARQELFTAVVGDVMDKLGLRRQFLPPVIRPLRREMVTIGRAMTVLEADFFEEGFAEGRNPISAQSFGLMFDALDDLKQNEIYTCTGASPRYALWGELMTVRALKCGAAGAVLDGYSRDTKGVLALGFPTFSWGSYGQDQGPRGKVVDYRVPVEIEGVRIHPGDIIFGDIDGVCVIPCKAEQDTFVAALSKVRREKTVRKALEDGMTAKAAFQKYGIL